MISASKSTLGLKNLKILRPKVTKNLTNLRKKFCESPPSWWTENVKTLCAQFFWRKCGKAQQSVQMFNSSNLKKDLFYLWASSCSFQLLSLRHKSQYMVKKCPKLAWKLVSIFSVYSQSILWNNCRCRW